METFQLVPALRMGNELLLSSTLPDSFILIHYVKVA